MTALSALHTVRRIIGIEEDDFRDLCQRLTGQRSTRAMTDQMRNAVRSELLDKYPNADRQKWRKRSDKDYVRKIFAVWTDLKNRNIWRDKRRSSLINFVKEMTGMDDPDFLTPADANRVIEALKAMKERGMAK